MLVIFGQRWKEQPIGQLELPCTKCQRIAFHNAVAMKGRFTIFFVPLIPLGSHYRLKCGLCGWRSRPAEPVRSQLRAWHQHGAAPQVAPQGSTQIASSPESFNYCGTCGKAISHLARFCNGCGQSVGQASASS